MTIEVVAAAKLNLGLEILGRRPDGYHEIISVTQSIDLCDLVRVSEAPTLELSVDGEELRGVPREGPRNLAFAAAQALAEAAGDNEPGARIELVKRIPAGAGLGGGSTDAAAALRGLNRLWLLNMSDEELCEVGARVGSDVPACLVGGAALITGRGEIVEPLADGPPMGLTLFIPDVEIPDKTRRMYAAVRPSDFSDGHKVRVLAESVRRGLPLASTDLVNAFDAHIRSVAPSVAGAMVLCRDAGLALFACGSGPGFFSPIALEELPPYLAHELERDWGVRTVGCKTMTRAEALAIREV